MDLLGNLILALIVLAIVAKSVTWILEVLDVSARSLKRRASVHPDLLRQDIERREHQLELFLDKGLTYAEYLDALNHSPYCSTCAKVRRLVSQGVVRGARVRLEVQDGRAEGQGV